MAIQLNHHSGLIIAYFADKTRKHVTFVTEQKSSLYRFPNRYGFIGGNYVAGVHSDISGLATLERERDEEFLKIMDDHHAESISFADGTPFIVAPEPNVAVYTQKEAVATREIGDILSSNLTYGGDFVCSLEIAPAKPLVFGMTAYVRKLTFKEMMHIGQNLNKTSWRPSTDNRKFGSYTRLLHDTELMDGALWHSAHNLLLDKLVRDGAVHAHYNASNQQDPLCLKATVEPLNIPHNVLRHNGGAPLYNSLESNGVVSYARK